MAGGGWAASPTGTINTSDAREKQQVRELSDAEQAVARKVKEMVRAFKFNSEVEKGGARTHVGVVAQDVIAAFASEGLNAEDYAILSKDDDRYGVRYEQLLAFIVATL